MNNPARLLLTQLQRLRSTSNRKNVRESLAVAFGDGSGLSDSDLRRALLLLDALFVATEERLRTLPRVKHERFLRYFSQLRDGLANLHLENTPASAFNFITDVALENLEAAADRIAEDFEEREIAPEELTQLDQEIAELFEYFDSAEIEPLLQQVGLDLLATLRQALAEYRIRAWKA